MITIIGAGLAGVSAALQAAGLGVEVKLYEMRPEKMTPAHSTGDLGELICSNSLGSTRITRAQGLLKEELRILGCELLEIAQSHSVPAGTGLTVNRAEFAREVTSRISENQFIELIREEVTSIPQELTILASGPLTSQTLAGSIARFCGEDYLYFYDAIAPIISADSLNLNKLTRAARYDAGEAGFLNAFLDSQQYLELYNALLNADQHTVHESDEDKSFFEGCLPVEEIARRGEKSLAFGPLRPTGFRYPEGRRPAAVIQLRPEDAGHTMYNLVGFQTNLRNGEQERVFRMIPGLENARFLRYGRMHRNTYIQAPQLISPTLQFNSRKELLICGQLSGAEGYLSAIGTGMVAGWNAARLNQGKNPIVLPSQSMLGALIDRISGTGEYASLTPRYQPTKPILALLPGLSDPPRSKEDRRQVYADRSIRELEVFLRDVSGSD